MALEHKGGVTGSITPPITNVGHVIFAISPSIFIWAISSEKKWNATSGRSIARSRKAPAADTLGLL